MLCVLYICLYHGDTNDVCSLFCLHFIVINYRFSKRINKKPNFNYSILISSLVVLHKMWVQDKIVQLIFVPLSAAIIEDESFGNVELKVLFRLSSRLL